MTLEADRPLEHFQTAFAHALTSADPFAEATADIAHLVRQPGFAVYRNTVMKGCIDALQGNYPSVARLVGEAWFGAAAAVYARANPPCNPTLLEYGSGFADFLAGFEPAAEVPYLSGVARLDRFWTEAHVARDEEPVEPSAIARLGAELARAVLRPHAAARWAWFDEYPVATLWRRNREPDPSHDLSEIEWRSEGMLIVRPRDHVTSVTLGAAGCAFLDACAAGRTLADAATAALAAEPAVDFSQLMALLLEAGAFGHWSAIDHDQEEEVL